jgi:hypothetical protein
MTQLVEQDVAFQSESEDDFMNDSFSEGSDSEDDVKSAQNQSRPNVSDEDDEDDDDEDFPRKKQKKGALHTLIFQYKRKNLFAKFNLSMRFCSKFTDTHHVHLNWIQFSSREKAFGYCHR